MRQVVARLLVGVGDAQRAVALVQAREDLVVEPAGLSLEATLHTDSQSSGPIVFNVDVIHDSELFMTHVHEIVDGEVRGEHLDAKNFEFEPARIFEDDPPRMIVLRLVGLNQHDEDGRVNDNSRLADGRYIGFIGAKSDHDTHLAAVVVLTVMAPSLPDLNMT